MTTDIEAPIPAPAPAAAKPNPWKRIVGVLFAPNETMKSITERPDWVVPLIVMIVISLAANIVMAPKLDFVTEAREQMIERGMPEEQVDESMEKIASVQKVMLPVSVVLIPVFLLLIAGLLFLAHKMFGGAGTFKQAFSVSTYAWMPLLVKGILMAIILIPKSNVPVSQMSTVVMSNPAFLVDYKDSPAMFALLSSIDLFTIWTLFLFIIGFAFLSRFSKARSAALIITLWLFMVLVKTGLASLQG